MYPPANRRSPRQCAGCVQGRCRYVTPCRKAGCTTRASNQSGWNGCLSGGGRVSSVRCCHTVTPLYRILWLEGTRAESLSASGPPLPGYHGNHESKQAMATYDPFTGFWSSVEGGTFRRDAVQESGCCLAYRRIARARRGGEGHLAGQKPTPGSGEPPTCF